MKKLPAVATAYVKRGRRKRCGEKNTWHAVAASRMEGAGAIGMLVCVLQKCTSRPYRGFLFIFCRLGRPDKTATS